MSDSSSEWGLVPTLVPVEKRPEQSLHLAPLDIGIGTGVLVFSSSLSATSGKH